MLVSEMLAEHRDHGFDDFTDSRILGHLNDAYFDVCSREHWPFLEASVSPTVDATGAVTSPTDIGKVIKLVDTGLGTVLEPIRLDAHTAYHAKTLTLTGSPYSYFFIGDTLYVYPISTSNVLTLRYLKVPPPLTISPDSSPLLPDRHDRVVLVGALVKSYLLQDDAENAGVFEQDFEARLAHMRTDLWQHQVDRPDTIQDMDEALDWADVLGFWSY